MSLKLAAFSSDPSFPQISQVARRTANICPSSIVLKDIYYSSFLESYVYPSVVPRIDIVGIKLPPVFLQLSSWSIGFSHDSYHLFICHAYM